MEQGQITLDISQRLSRAVDFAFKEAQEQMDSGAGLAPFTVTVVDDGLEINDHSANTEDDVYDSVKTLLAADMPEAYALCYDGYVETDDGRQDAIVVEAADRGAARATALAMIYTSEDGETIFEANYGYAGSQPQLYPEGTRPITSGMAALSEEDLAAMEAEREQGDAVQPEEGGAGENGDAAADEADDIEAGDE